MTCLLALGTIALAMAAPATFASASVARTPAAPSATIHLTGAGSTFDAPFFLAAFSKYRKLHPSISISYAAVGSGLGITHFSAGSVNFGASDVPMTPAEQAGAKGGEIVQVPIDLGAVVVSYNLGALLHSGPLRLTGPVLAKIYLGKITNWSDPAIVALNPGAELPDENITVVHRSDGSGTTYIFTNYLSSVSSAWASGPGTNKAINWPVGEGAKGSPGVAQQLKAIPGSIGYFELSYAETTNLPYFEIENRSGVFVPPFAANVAADASMKANVSSSNFSIVNERGRASYPISGYSWILLYLHQPNATTGSALAKLVDWMTHAGQSVAAASYYVPLPGTISLLAYSTVAKLVGPTGSQLDP